MEYLYRLFVLYFLGVVFFCDAIKVPASWNDEMSSRGDYQETSETSNSFNSAGKISPIAEQKPAVGYPLIVGPQLNPQPSESLHMNKYPIENQPGYSQYHGGNQQLYSYHPGTPQINNYPIGNQHLNVRPPGIHQIYSSGNQQVNSYRPRGQQINNYPIENQQANNYPSENLHNINSYSPENQNEVNSYNLPENQHINSYPIENQQPGGYSLGYQHLNMHPLGSGFPGGNQQVNSYPVLNTHNRNPSGQVENQHITSYPVERQKPYVHSAEAQQVNNPAVRQRVHKYSGTRPVPGQIENQPLTSYPVERQQPYVHPAEVQQLNKYPSGRQNPHKYATQTSGNQQQAGEVNVYDENGHRIQKSQPAPLRIKLKQVKIQRLPEGNRHYKPYRGQRSNANSMIPYSPEYYAQSAGNKFIVKSHPVYLNQRPDNNPAVVINAYPQVVRPSRKIVPTPKKIIYVNNIKHPKAGSDNPRLLHLQHGSDYNSPQLQSQSPVYNNNYNKPNQYLQNQQPLLKYPISQSGQPVMESDWMPMTNANPNYRNTLMQSVQSPQQYRTLPNFFAEKDPSFTNTANVNIESNHNYRTLPKSYNVNEPKIQEFSANSTEEYKTLPKYLTEEKNSEDYPNPQNDKYTETEYRTLPKYLTENTNNEDVRPVSEPETKIKPKTKANIYRTKIKTVEETKETIFPNRFPPVFPNNFQEDFPKISEPAQLPDFVGKIYENDPFRRNGEHMYIRDSDYVKEDPEKQTTSETNVPSEDIQEESKIEEDSEGVKSPNEPNTPITEHEEAREINVPTKPIYPGVGQWAKPGRKHRVYERPENIQAESTSEQESEEENVRPDGYETFEQGADQFNRANANFRDEINQFPRKYLSSESTEEEDEESEPLYEKPEIGFVPRKLYAQIRKTEETQHLPQSAAYEDAESYEDVVNAPRLREVVKDTRAHTVYTEEGYEDSAYDHAGHEKKAANHEGHDQLEDDYERTGNKKNKKRKSNYYQDDGRYKQETVPSEELKEVSEDYEDSQESQVEDTDSSGSEYKTGIANMNDVRSEMKKQMKTVGKDVGKFRRNPMKSTSHLTKETRQTVVKDSGDDNLDMEVKKEIEQVVMPENGKRQSDKYHITIKQPKIKIKVPKVPKYETGQSEYGTTTVSTLDEEESQDVTEKVQLITDKNPVKQNFFLNVNEFNENLGVLKDLTTEIPTLGSIESTVIGKVDEAFDNVGSTIQTSTLSNNEEDFVLAPTTLVQLSTTVESTKIPNLSKAKTTARTKSTELSKEKTASNGSKNDIEKTKKESVRYGEKLNPVVKKKNESSADEKPHVRVKRYDKEKLSKIYIRRRPNYYWEKNKKDNARKVEHNRFLESTKKDNTRDELTTLIQSENINKNNKNHRILFPSAKNRPKVNQAKPTTIKTPSPESDVLTRKKRFTVDIPKLDIKELTYDIVDVSKLPDPTPRPDLTYLKYPYYKLSETKIIPKHSPLRYAQNMRHIPRKTDGGTEFYDSTSNIQCPEIPDTIDPIPDHIKNKDKEVREKENEDGEDGEGVEHDVKIGQVIKGPRLVGLGDKIDCLKVKYFGENPLDNPLFKEETIEAPEPVFAINKALLGSESKTLKVKAQAPKREKGNSNTNRLSNHKLDSNNEDSKINNSSSIMNLNKSSNKKSFDMNETNLLNLKLIAEFLNNNKNKKSVIKRNANGSLVDENMSNDILDVESRLKNKSNNLKNLTNNITNSSVTVQVTANINENETNGSTTDNPPTTKVSLTTEVPSTNISIKTDKAHADLKNNSESELNKNESLKNGTETGNTTKTIESMQLNTTNVNETMKIISKNDTFLEFIKTAAQFYKNKTKNGTRNGREEKTTTTEQYRTLPQFLYDNPSSYDKILEGSELPPLQLPLVDPKRYRENLFDINDYWPKLKHYNVSAKAPNITSTQQMDVLSDIMKNIKNSEVVEEISTTMIPKKTRNNTKRRFTTTTSSTTTEAEEAETSTVPYIKKQRGTTTTEVYENHNYDSEGAETTNDDEEEEEDVDEKKIKIKIPKPRKRIRLNSHNLFQSDTHTTETFKYGADKSSTTTPMSTTGGQKLPRNYDYRQTSTEQYEKVDPSLISITTTRPITLMPDFTENNKQKIDVSTISITTEQPLSFQISEQPNYEAVGFRTVNQVQIPGLKNPLPVLIPDGMKPTPVILSKGYAPMHGMHYNGLGVTPIGLKSRPESAIASHVHIIRPKPTKIIKILNPRIKTPPRLLRNKIMTKDYKVIEGLVPPLKSESVANYAEFRPVTFTTDVTSNFLPTVPDSLATETVRIISKRSLKTENESKVEPETSKQKVTKKTYQEFNKSDRQSNFYPKVENENGTDSTTVNSIRIQNETKDVDSLENKNSSEILTKHSTNLENSNRTQLSNSEVSDNNSSKVITRRSDDFQQDDSSIGEVLDKQESKNYANSYGLFDIFKETTIPAPYEYHDIRYPDDKSEYHSDSSSREQSEPVLSPTTAKPSSTYKPLTNAYELGEGYPSVKCDHEKDKLEQDKRLLQRNPEEESNPSLKESIIVMLRRRLKELTNINPFGPPEMRNQQSNEKSSTANYLQDASSTSSSFSGQVVVPCGAAKQTDSSPYVANVGINVDQRREEPRYLDAQLPPVRCGSKIHAAENINIPDNSQLPLDDNKQLMAQLYAPNVPNTASNGQLINSENYLQQNPVQYVTSSPTFQGEPQRVTIPLENYQQNYPTVNPEHAIYRIKAPKIFDINPFIPRTYSNKVQRSSRYHQSSKNLPFIPEPKIDNHHNTYAIPDYSVNKPNPSLSQQILDILATYPTFKPISQLPPIQIPEYSSPLANQNIYSPVIGTSTFTPVNQQDLKQIEYISTSSIRPADSVTFTTENLNKHAEFSTVNPRAINEELEYRTESTNRQVIDQENSSEITTHLPELQSNRFEYPNRQEYEDKPTLPPLQNENKTTDRQAGNNYSSRYNFENVDLPLPTERTLQKPVLLIIEKQVQPSTTVKPTDDENGKYSDEVEESPSEILEQKQENPEETDERYENLREAARKKYSEEELEKTRDYPDEIHENGKYPKESEKIREIYENIRDISKNKYRVYDEQPEETDDGNESRLEEYITTENTFGARILTTKPPPVQNNGYRSEKVLMDSTVSPKKMWIMTRVHKDEAKQPSERRNQSRFRQSEQDEPEKEGSSRKSRRQSLESSAGQNERVEEKEYVIPLVKRKASEKRPRQHKPKIENESEKPRNTYKKASKKVSSKGDDDDFFSYHHDKYLEDIIPKFTPEDKESIPFAPVYSKPVAARRMDVVEEAEESETLPENYPKGFKKEHRKHIPVYENADYDEEQKKNDETISESDENTEKSVKALPISKFIYKENEKRRVEEYKKPILNIETDESEDVPQNTEQNERTKNTELKEENNDYEDEIESKNVEKTKSVDSAEDVTVNEETDQLRISKPHKNPEVEEQADEDKKIELIKEENFEQEPEVDEENTEEDRIIIEKVTNEKDIEDDTKTSNKDDSLIKEETSDRKSDKNKNKGSIKIGKVKYNPYFHPNDHSRKYYVPEDEENSQEDLVSENSEKQIKENLENDDEVVEPQTDKILNRQKKGKTQIVEKGSVENASEEIESRNIKNKSSQREEIDADVRNKENEENHNKNLNEKEEKDTAQTVTETSDEIYTTTEKPFQLEKIQQHHKTADVETTEVHVPEEEKEDDSEEDGEETMLENEKLAEELENEYDEIEEVDEVMAPDYSEFVEVFDNFTDGPKHGGNYRHINDQKSLGSRKHGQSSRNSEELDDDDSEQSSNFRNRSETSERTSDDEDDEEPVRTFSSRKSTNKGRDDDSYNNRRLSTRKNNDDEEYSTIDDFDYRRPSVPYKNKNEDIHGSNTRRVESVTSNYFKDRNLAKKVNNLKDKGEFVDSFEEHTDVVTTVTPLDLKDFSTVIVKDPSKRKYFYVD